VNIAVVTDSSCSLPIEEIRQYGIGIVPIPLVFGSQVLLDGPECDREHFYSVLRDRPGQTSQPSPGDFIKFYQSLKGRFQSIVSLHVTGLASGTVRTAMIARDYLKDDMDIEVVDSESTAMGLGFLALVAARAARLGATKDDIVRRIEETKTRIGQYIALPTLEYLRRSGRVGRGQSLLASLLDIKPVLTMSEGLLTVVDRVRSYPRAVSRCLDLLSQKVGEARVELAVMHASVPAEAERLVETCRQRLNAVRTYVTELSPALVVHGGPGMLGLAAMTVD